MANPSWIAQQLKRMEQGIVSGKTRKRNIASVKGQGILEEELAAAVAARGWKLAQVGNDYIFAPGGYVIRPIN